MPRNGKTNCPEDCQEDIRWFEDYEKRSKSEERPAGLSNQDILKYIRDIERNCRLEVSSGDEDYAGTKRSSNCSVRFSGTGASRPSKKARSRVTSKRNRNAVVHEERIRESSARNTVDACAYCCQPRGSRFNPGDPGCAVQENTGKDLSGSAKSAHRYPKSSSKRDFRGYRQLTAPRFHGWYSRKGRKTWPPDTEMTGLEVIQDWSRDAFPDSRVDSSEITEKRSARVRTFKSLRKRFDESSCANTRSNTFAHNDGERRKGNNDNARARSKNGEGDVSDLVKRPPLDRSRAIDKLATRSYPVLSKRAEYEGRYPADYPDAAGRFALPVSRDASSRSNRLTTRLAASSPAPRRLAPSRRNVYGFTNQTGRPLKASSFITRTSIDRKYQETRETRYNNTNQWPRRSDVSRIERGSSYYRELDHHHHHHPRESDKLCKVIRTREDRQRLGCCCEDVERNETADCSGYCCCPEKVPTREDNGYRSPIDIATNEDYAEREETRRETPFRSMRSRLDGASDFDLSTGLPLRKEAAATFEKSGLSDREPEEPLADDWMRQMRGVARRYKKWREKTLPGKISGDYLPGERYSVDAGRAPRKFESLGSDSACECEEIFHDVPACQVGSCSCVRNDEDVDEDVGADSSREDSACCCCASSTRLRGDEDPLRKLESFCERVKAVNRDALRKSSASTRCNPNCDQTRYRQCRRDGNKTTPGSRGWERSTDFLFRTRRLGKESSKRRRSGEKNLERILIYPPRGASGPPLTLYKRSSNINCRVKGDANSGFHYDVTYVQKFVSPTWMPDLSPRVPLHDENENEEECGCFVDHG